MKATEVKELVKHVKNEKMVQLFTQMYGESRVEENAKRYEMVAEGFVKEFGDKEFEFFSAPGRTEIGGNHHGSQPWKDSGRQRTSGLRGSRGAQRHQYGEADQ